MDLTVQSIEIKEGIFRLIPILNGIKDPIILSAETYQNLQTELNYFKNHCTKSIFKKKSKKPKPEWSSDFNSNKTINGCFNSLSSETT